MAELGRLPTRNAILNNRTWEDAIEYVDDDGNPMPLTQPIKIGLRLKWTDVGYTFLVEPSEIFVEGNTAIWTVPAERMQTIKGDLYLLEILSEHGDIWGELQILEGVNP